MKNRNAGIRRSAGVILAHWIGWGMALAGAGVFGQLPKAGEYPQAELVSVRMIWDQGEHNAFTDLARHRDSWYCVFREGSGHVSPDGAIRVLRSRTGLGWRSVALLESPQGDLRDPKLVVAADGRLMLTAAIALEKGLGSGHQTVAWYSEDGREWGQPIEIGERNVWLWRVEWRGREALGVGYSTQGEPFTRLYRSLNGRDFETWVPRLFADGQPNEAGLVFDPDDRAWCLLRRDGAQPTGQLGWSRPPYRTWNWQPLGVRIGGPQMIRLPDGNLLAAVRLYEPQVRTSLVWVDRTTGQLTECLRLPSGGDTSYAGMQWHESRLWMSYYSSHEGRTSIYLAKVRFRGARGWLH